MRHAITITLFLTFIFIGCSSDDDNPRLIQAEKYGIIVRSLSNQEIDFSYTFKEYNSGEIYHQGATTTPNSIYFPVTEKETSVSLNVLVEIRVDQENVDSIISYTISKSNNLYYNDRNNRNATTVFELNPIDYIEELEYFEGSINLQGEQRFWQSEL